MIEFHSNIEKFDRIMGDGWYEYVINKNFEIIKKRNRKRNKKEISYYPCEDIKLYNIHDIKYKIVPDIKNFYILGVKEKNSSYYPCELAKDLQIMKDFNTSFFNNMLERFINMCVFLEIDYCDNFPYCKEYNNCERELPTIEGLKLILTLIYDDKDYDDEDYDKEQPYIKNYYKLCKYIRHFPNSKRERLEELYLNCLNYYDRKCKNSILCMNCLNCSYSLLGYDVKSDDLKKPLII